MMVLGGYPILKQRRKLVIDQPVRAGINAFSRYENGKTKPPLALVKLLKVLDRHPELLNEVKPAEDALNSLPTRPAREGCNQATPHCTGWNPHAAQRAVVIAPASFPGFVGWAKRSVPTRH